MITEDKVIGKFNTKDFRCKHCKELYISEDLINKLNKLGEMLHFSKAKVVSGYRCSQHPIEVKSKNTGQHTKGMAGDIIYYDKDGKEIPAKYVICVAWDSDMFRGLANDLNPNTKGETHIDIRTTGGYYRGDETKDYKSHWTNPYTYYGVTKEEVAKYTEVEMVTPTVERDETKDQLKVLVNALSVRKEPNTNGNKIGTAIKGGIYNYYEITSDDKYIWYKIADNQWVANNGQYLEVYPKVIPNPVTPIDDKDKKIQELQDELKKQEALVNSLQSENADLKQTIELQKVEIQELDKQIEDLKNTPETYKFKYTCKETGLYEKTLEVGDILTIK